MKKDIYSIITTKMRENIIRRRYFKLFISVLTVFLIFPKPSSAEIPSTIVVGGDRDYPPYEFIDSDGKPAGYNVDLTKAIAEVMGIKVEFKLGTWNVMRNALMEGGVDVLPGMSWSEKRLSEVDFSLPHTIVNHAIFARRETPMVNSLDDIRGKKIAMHRGGIMHDYLVQQKFPCTLVLTDTPADAIRQLSAGMTDFAIVAIVPGMYLIRELKLTNLVPVVRNVATYRYCYAVNKGNEDLLSRLNEGLAILKKTGQYEIIYNQWLGVLDPDRSRWKTEAKHAAKIVVPLILLLGGLALWSRMLQRQVALRTADLTREITERKQTEKELRINQEQLVQAHKMAALGVLVSGVAHEINNPTGLILLDIPILKRAQADIAQILEKNYAEQGDFYVGGLPYSEMRKDLPRILDEMHDGAKRIKHIVNDLKDFARLGTTDDKILINLNIVTTTALRLVDSTIRKTTNHFLVSLGDDIPEIFGSAQRIEQIIVNLIINACQALTHQEMGISVATCYDSAHKKAILQICDEGIGITPEHIHCLTDPFFTTKRDIGGMGLGLSVSAGIVKEHGGKLSFESTLGVGTTVTLELPASNLEDAT